MPVRPKAKPRGQPTADHFKGEFEAFLQNKVETNHGLILRTFGLSDTRELQLDQQTIFLAPRTYTFDLKRQHR